MLTTRVRIPFGVVGMAFGTACLIFGGDDLYWVWLSGFNIGWGAIQTITMLHIWASE